MPRTWIEPEVFHTISGQGDDPLKIYHIYKNDDYDQGERRYWFSPCELGSDDGMQHGEFDVRELAKILGMASPDVDEEKKAVMDQAFKEGRLRPCPGCGTPAS